MVHLAPLGALRPRRDQAGRQNFVVPVHHFIALVLSTAVLFVNEIVSEDDVIVLRCHRSVNADSIDRWLLHRSAPVFHLYLVVRPSIMTDIVAKNLYQFFISFKMLFYFLEKIRSIL